MAVAPSDPNVIYVGSGEGLQRPDLSHGDGIYKSTDAGKTWTHLGLRDGQQIPQIIVDPHDPNRLFVAVLGHPYGPNDERGIFRSTDGGTDVREGALQDENTGAVDVAFDPSNPQTVYAVLWEARQAPWENGEFTGPGSGLFKSTDGGTTWRPLIAKGLPTFGGWPGPHRLAVAPSDPQRLYATVELRTKARPLSIGRRRRELDAGQRGHAASPSASDDFAEVKVDPKNPDVVYTASMVVWKSTDGGQDVHRRSAARRAATTTTASGSTPTTRRSCCSPATRARSSPSTAATPGAPGTTSRRRSSTT